MSIADLEQEFHALQAAFGPHTEIPPNCFTMMKGTYRAYESRVSLTVEFPVLPEYLNPVGAMQGGLIAAAMDNTLGPLSYLAARAPCTTLDLHTQYLRPIEAGDVLTVKADVISRSRRTLTMSAEATNGQGKLVARSSSTLLIVRENGIPPRTGEKK